METKKRIVLIVMASILLTSFSLRPKDDLEYVIHANTIFENKPVKIEIKNHSQQNYYIILDTLYYGNYIIHSPKEGEGLMLHPYIQLKQQNRNVDYESSITDSDYDIIIKEHPIYYNSFSFIKKIPAKSSVFFVYTFKRSIKVPPHRVNGQYDTIYIDYLIPKGHYKAKFISEIKSSLIEKYLSLPIQDSLSKKGFIPYNGKIHSNNVKLKVE
jgi:hypothetical protein